MHLFIFADPVFQMRYLGNTLEDYIWCVFILLAGFIFKRFISKFLSRQLYRICQKYSKGVGPDKFLGLLVAPFNLFVMLVILYFAFYRLEYPAEWNLGPENQFGLRMVTLKSFQILLVVSITWVFLRLTDYFGLVLLNRASMTESKSDDQLVPFIKESIKIIISILSLFFILGSIFQVNVASLLAGLGIGGLAIALAAKESLENLLGSFTIFLDKPFTIGDLIRAGDVTGHVEKIGFRSTRIRTLDKTFITVPNKKMVDAELENLSLRNLFRARFTIGLGYDSSPANMKKVISDIQNLLDSEPLIADERTVNFTDFNCSSLDLLIIFFVKTTDMEEFMMIKEKINFRLMEIIENNHCSFAIPTTRIRIEKEGREI